MARNDSVDVPANTWTQITNADVASLTFQNVGGHSLFIKATTDETAPTNTNGALLYPPGQGESSERTLASIFPGLSGADRVWVYGVDGGRVMVSHA